MKNTLTRLLTAALAGLLLAGTAAGCGTRIEIRSEQTENSTVSNAENTSMTIAESSVTDTKKDDTDASSESGGAEKSDNSGTEDSDDASGKESGSENSGNENSGGENSGNENSGVREFDVSRLTKDNLEDCYSGKGVKDDRTYEAVFLTAKDGETSYAVVYIFDCTDSDKTEIAGYANGIMETMSSSVWEDGSLHSYGTIKDEVRGNTLTVNMTDYGDGNRDVVFEGTGIYFRLSAVKEFESITEKLGAAKRIYDLTYESYVLNRSLEDAKTLDDACRDYFADVISGRLTAETNGRVILDEIPSSEYTGIDEKKEMVAKLSVGGAMQYAGIDPETFDLTRFEIDEDGRFAVKSENSGLAVITDVTPDTLLREFFKD